jgi:streptogramin lyase
VRLGARFRVRWTSIPLALGIAAALAWPGVPAIAAVTVTEFPVPTASAGVEGITAGPDGNLWFAESSADQIGRITPSGMVTQFRVTAGAAPVGIAVGPDGALWFTEYDANKIGRMTTGGSLTNEFPIITANADPYAIAKGSDGNMWFSEISAQKIARITPGGSVSEFNAFTRPQGIATGPDGNPWFAANTDAGSAYIGKWTPAQLYLWPATSGAGAAGITAGPDGNLWFTEALGNRVGRITTAGTVTEFSLGITPGAGPDGIAAGPDGNLWFTEINGNRIAFVTTSGTVTEISAGISPAPFPGSGPDQIAAGPDGNLWFTESGTNRIGRAQRGPPGASTGAAANASLTSADLAGTASPGGEPTTAYFEYGPTADYGARSAVQQVGSGSSPVGVAATIGGLSPATTYHYRLVVGDPAGATSGGDRTFTTASPPPVTGGSPPPARITSPITWTYKAKARYTTFGSLVVRNVPAGARVVLRCTRPKHKKRGCPFTRKAVPVAKGRANATKLLRHKRFAVGATLEVWITKPGEIGKVLRLTIRKRKAPKSTALCLPPGAKQPAAC